MKYFITNAPLLILEEAERINWTGFGFSVDQVSQALRAGFQQREGERMVSILPIYDEKLLRQKLGDMIDTEDEYGYYRIITEAEAITERDRLKAANDALEEAQRNIPNDDDVFRAQQLKLLTEIKLGLGGAQNA